jgi:hypothetical protein
LSWQLIERQINKKMIVAFVCFEFTIIGIT